MAITARFARRFGEELRVRHHLMRIVVGKPDVARLAWQQPVCRILVGLRADEEIPRRSVHLYGSQVFLPVAHQAAILVRLGRLRALLRPGNLSREENEQDNCETPEPRPPAKTRE